jgi:hypothetical protein
VFAPAMKADGLFYVYDSFEKAARRLQFAVADYWDQFEDVLDIRARSKWSNLIIGIVDNQRTHARFLACVSTLIQKYAENTNPRDIMFAYLRTEIRKPRNIDPGAHASRVETLCRSSNRLQGTEAELTEIQIRKLVFETFPSIWQTEYYKSQREFATDTIQGIIGYMNLCQGSADTDKERRKKKRRTDDTPCAHGGNKNDTNKNKGNWRNKSEEAENKPCTAPHANYKFHLWKDCSLNPKSTNFRFSSQGSGRSGGRGNYNNGQLDGAT